MFQLLQCGQNGADGANAVLHATTEYGVGLEFAFSLFQQGVGVLQRNRDLAMMLFVHVSLCISVVVVIVLYYNGIID